MNRSLSSRSRAVVAAGLLLMLAVTRGEAQERHDPIPAAPGALSVERNPIGAILADPAGHDVLETYAGNLVASPGLDQIKGMTLIEISAYPESGLDYGKLVAIQRALNAARR